MSPLVTVAVLGTGIIAEPKFSRFSRLEERTGLLHVRVRNKNLHGAQTVNRDAMRVTHGFTTLHRPNAGCGEERADLLRVKLAVRNEYASRLRLHDRSLASYIQLYPTFDSVRQIPLTDGDGRRRDAASPSAEKRGSNRLAPTIRRVTLEPGCRAFRA